MLISVFPIVPLKCSDTKFDRIFSSELTNCKKIKIYFEYRGNLFNKYINHFLKCFHFTIYGLAYFNTLGKCL